MSEIYDVVILGAGPAGLTAGMYAGRSRMRTLILEKERDGGQIALTNEIENYPGQMLTGESGPSLVARMAQQASQFGAQRVNDEILRAELTGEVKKLVGAKGEYLARTVIVACGASARPIGCENEEKFIGRGISFCATCDARFFRDLEVYVVGGGDAAVEEAIYLTQFARRVTVIHRRDQLRAAQSIQQKAFANPKIRFLLDSVVTRVDGQELLDTVTVKNVKTGQETVLRADEADGLVGLFAFVGYVPNTSVFAGALELDRGYIVTDADMRTNLPGVFAAGDVRVKSLRQVITAAADGAVAAAQARHYLEKT